jgi:hypothetical protein
VQYAAADRGCETNEWRKPLSDSVDQKLPPICRALNQTRSTVSMIAEKPEGKRNGNNN